MGLCHSLWCGSNKARAKRSERGKSVNVFDEESQQKPDPSCVHGLHPPGETRPSGTPPELIDVRQINDNSAERNSTTPTEEKRENDKPETIVFHPCQEQEESPGSSFDECRFEILQQKVSKAIALNKELQREMEWMQAEMTRFKTMHLKALKDAEKKYEEERDKMLNEMDGLKTELELVKSQLKNMSTAASEKMEALGQKSTFKRPQTPKMGRRSIAIFASALQNGSHFIDEGKRGSTAHLPSRKLDENDLGFQRIEEPKIKKPSPRSTPALRHKLTPVPIPIPPHQVQKCTPASHSRPSSIRLAGSSITLLREGVKIPWTPRLPKTGSKRFHGINLQNATEQPRGCGKEMVQEDGVTGECNQQEWKKPAGVAAVVSHLGDHEELD